MLRKVESTIREFGMGPDGSKIVVGISGGPDSTTLLHLLCRLREKHHLQLWAAHLNHGIREKEAKEDEKWVKLFAQKLNIPLTVDAIDVPLLAREKGDSLESVARQVRYNFLEHFANKVGADRIAVGHTASDQAETVLMRLIRGSGVDGLAGIPPVRGRVIRPLIRTFKWEIEDYCRRYKLAPRRDSSNKDLYFFRNRIRFELIPHLHNCYNPRVAETLHRTADILQGDKDLLDKLTKKAKKKVVKKKRGKEVVINGRILSQMHLSLQRRVIRHVLEELKGSLGGIEYSHIEQILHLRESEGTKLTHLPGEVRAWQQYGELILRKGKGKRSDFFSHVNVPGETRMPQLSIVLNTKILSQLPTHFPQDSYQAFFDLDKIPGSLYLRSRKEGDKFVPLGMRKEKKLKDFFIDLKVPKLERGRIPILLSKDKIVWVVGYRIDDRFKLDQDSKKTLHIKVAFNGSRGRSKKKNRRNRG